MSGPPQISAGRLGGLALPDFCPRCYWVERRLGELPFRTPMPGIFSSIDSYTKRVVHAHLDGTGALPLWLPDVGEVVGYLPVPSHREYRAADPETGVVLTGVPDDILCLEDSSFVIVDYKTARYTGTQDALFPRYEVQLNAYARIALHLRVAPVSGLYLIYFEPRTEPDPEGCLDLNGDRLSLGFEARRLVVEHRPDGLLPPLLREVRRLHDQAGPPEGAEGCADCRGVEALARLWAGPGAARGA